MFSWNGAIARNPTSSEVVGWSPRRVIALRLSLRPHRHPIAPPLFQLRTNGLKPTANLTSHPFPFPTSSPNIQIIYQAIRISSAIIRERATRMNESKGGRDIKRPCFEPTENFTIDYRVLSTAFRLRNLLHLSSSYKRAYNNRSRRRHWVRFTQPRN